MARRRNNCNTPDTCSLNVVGALKFLSGTTAQCEPQALEQNPPGLICDTPSGIRSLQGSDAEPIFLPYLGQNNLAAMACVVLDANGRLRAITQGNAADIGVPVYEAGAVSIRDLAFMLQNFNEASIANVGNCGFDVTVWAQCSADGPLSLKKISMTDFIDAFTEALILDTEALNRMFCAGIPPALQLDHILGCNAGVAGSLAAPGSGYNEIISKAGKWQTQAKGLQFYPYEAGLLSAAPAGNYTIALPGYPAAPPGAVWARFESSISNIVSGECSIILNVRTLNFCRDTTGSAQQNYAYSSAPVPASSQTFNVVAVSSTPVVSLLLLGYEY